MEFDKINGNVGFNEEQHIYQDLNTGKRFISCTTLIHHYNNFNKELISGKKALEALRPALYPSYKQVLNKVNSISDSMLVMFGVTREEFEVKRKEITDGWEAIANEACIKGTAYHLDMEHALYAKNNPWLKEHMGDREHYCKQGDFDIMRQDVGVFPEYLIHWSSDDDMLKIAGQVDVLIKDGQFIDILDFKGLAIDTPIATPDGFTAIGDLKIGDTVFDGNGMQTKVKNVSNIHYKDCYRVTFDTNDEIVCDHEHKWVITERLRDGSNIEKEMTTDEMFKHIESGNPKLKIQVSGCIDTEEKDLPIDPYVLGCWLGDGSKACGIITNINEKTWEEICNRGYEIGPDLAHGKSARMHTVYGLRTKLRELGLLMNKHIPMIYLRASREQRLDLLRGFMDTDGHLNVKRKRNVMGTTQKWQADYTMQLVSSLGWKPTFLTCTKQCGDLRIPGYDVCFHADENVFLTRNEDYFDIVTNRPYMANVRYIKSIEKIDTVPTRCIEVESESHTYLAGENMIKTHNSNREIRKTSFFNPKTKRTTKMKSPLNMLDDCNFNHYNLQLSMYAWMVTQQHPELQVRTLKILHHDHDGNNTVYEMPFLKDRVEDIVKDYHKKVKIEKQRAELNNLL